MDGPKDLPLPSYVRRVKSVSGDIDVEMALLHADIESLSGDIRAEFRPVLSTTEDVKAVLSTSLTAGTLDLSVLEPYPHRTGKWALKSEHKIVAGDAKIRLPDAWEGGFSVSSLLGRARVEGDGVRFGDRLTGEVRGVRGDGESGLRVETMAGDVWVRIGREFSR